MRSPARTREPGATEPTTGSYVVRNPFGWSTDTTGLVATIPAKTTTPSPAVRMPCPSRPARSTPRCPGNHSCSGGSKDRTTSGRGSRGHTNGVWARAGGASRIATASSTHRHVTRNLIVSASPWTVRLLPLDTDLWRKIGFIHRRPEVLTDGPGYVLGKQRRTLLERPVPAQVDFARPRNCVPVFGRYRSVTGCRRSHVQLVWVRQSADARAGVIRHPASTGNRKRVIQLWL
jgi:hypothetical protein